MIKKQTDSVLRAKRYLSKPIVSHPVNKSAGSRLKKLLLSVSNVVFIAICLSVCYALFKWAPSWIAALATLILALLVFFLTTPISFLTQAGTPDESSTAALFDNIDALSVGGHSASDLKDPSLLSSDKSTILTNLIESASDQLTPHHIEEKKSHKNPEISLQNQFKK